jgi:hypothetical protein
LSTGIDTLLHSHSVVCGDDTGRQPAQSISDNGIDLPKWVQSVVREEWTGEVFDLELKTYLHGEEEMVNLLQIAMSCVEPKPDERPEMAAVVDLLDSIRRGESVVDSESYVSRETDGDYSSNDITKGDYSGPIGSPSFTPMHMEAPTPRPTPPH